jgi:hypothetical protein
LVVPTTSAPFDLSLDTEILSIGDINESRLQDAAVDYNPLTNKLSFIDNGIPSKNPNYFF